MYFFIVPASSVASSFGTTLQAGAWECKQSSLPHWQNNAGGEER